MRMLRESRIAENKDYEEQVASNREEKNASR